MEELYSSEDTCYYENDLQLAAELGKTLLERNKDLETQLAGYQQENHELQLENEFLVKQVEALREVSESRMKIYEDLDKSSHELEKTNQMLVKEAATEKQRSQRLQDTIESLESKCSSLQAKIDEMKLAERQRLKCDGRRTKSVPSLINDVDNLGKLYYDYVDINNLKNAPITGYDAEIRELQETIRKLRAKQGIEQRRRDELEVELAVALSENRALEVKVKDLDGHAQTIKSLEAELQDMQVKMGELCAKCKGELKTVRSEIEAELLEPRVESDVTSIETSARVVKLQNGGSAYGSQESLNMVARDHSAHDLQIVSPSPSFLSELDAQYNALVSKYEDLLHIRGNKKSTSTSCSTDDTADDSPPRDVQAKKRLSRGFPTSNKEIQTEIFLRKYNSDPTMNRFDHAPPEYKRIFKEIFETLKKSIIEEDQMSDSAMKNSSSF